MAGIFVSMRILSQLFRTNDVSRQLPLDAADSIWKTRICISIVLFCSSFECQWRGVSIRCNTEVQCKIHVFYGRSSLTDISDLIVMLFVVVSVFMREAKPCCGC